MKSGNGRIGNFREGIERKLGLEGRAKKRCFRIVFLLLVLYAEAVVFGQSIYYDLVNPLLSVVSAVAVPPLCLAGVMFCKKINIHTGKRRDGRLAVAFGMAVFLATFLILFLWQAAYWPGSFQSDCIDQYGMMLNGEYSDWHPVLHTWLFYLLPYRLLHRPAGIVLMQIVWFSLAVAYLFYVLYGYGYSGSFLFLSWLYIILNYNTDWIMLFPMKDSAMSIFALVLFTFLIRIYATRGDWLKGHKNLILFSVIAFLTNGMRHNALLLVVPVYVVLFIFMKPVRRQLCISALTVLAATILLKGPMFDMLGVARPGNRQLEMSGVPMTVLSDIYVSDREALDPEAQDFMDSLVTPEEWKTKYEPGSFNSIKFSSGVGDKVESKGLKDILSYACRAAIQRPGIAVKAFVKLTGMVWVIDGGNGCKIGAWIDDNPYGIHYHYNERLHRACNVYGASAYITKYLFGYIGVVILFLMFMAVGKIGNGRRAQAFMVLSPLAYDLGTMLLLSGPDFRFFHYNFVIVVPLMAIFCMKKEFPGNGVSLAGEESNR